MTIFIKIKDYMWLLNIRLQLVLHNSVENVFRKDDVFFAHAILYDVVNCLTNHNMVLLWNYEVNEFT